DQNQSIAPRRDLLGLVQLEPPTHEMKDVSPVALINPKQSLRTKDVVRDVLEKMLELVDVKWLVSFERYGVETVGRHMKMIRSVEQLLIRLEQSDAEDQRQRNEASRRSHDPRAVPDPADLLLDLIQAVGADEVAFVEQNSVGVAQLIVRGLAFEKLEAEVPGVCDRNDRVHAYRIAKFRTQEGQHDG